MSQVGKHRSEEKVNGDLSSPSKLPKMEGSPDHLSHEERLAKVKDFFGKGGPKPPPPKPKPKKLPQALHSENMDEGRDTPPYSPLSPGMEDPGSIVLNMESLSQLSTIMEIDLDAVVREQEILENQALKDRAALSQSKGLQTRRLPKSYVSKVPADYAARRRAQSYSALSTAYSEGTDSPHRGSTPEISEEERKQRILSRSGVSQGSNPLAALGNILKRKNSLRGSKSPKSPKKDKKDSPRHTPKMKKKDSLGTPDSATVSKGFFGSLRRSSSRNSGRKKGKFDTVSLTASANVSTEDLRADNSSVISMPIHPSPSPRRSDEPIITSTPIKKPNYDEREPTPQKSTIATKMPLNDRSFVSPERRRDSSLFREPSVEKLFDSDSSNLFGSSELDAFFMKEKEERSPERSISESKEECKEVETPPTSDIEVKASMSRQSESKSNIRSRLHAYERASTSDGTVKPPPVVEEGSKDEQEDVKQGTKDEKKEKPTENKVKESVKPLPRGNKEKKEDDVKKGSTKKVSDLFDDLEEDDLFGPTKTPTSPSFKPSVQSDLDKKKASLFEDELFQDHTPKSKPPPVKKEPPKVMPKKPRKSVDGSPKRETKKETVKLPEPPSAVVDTRPTVEKSVSATVEKSVTKLEETKEEPKVEEPKKEEKKPDTISSSFFDDGSELPVYGLRRKSRLSQTVTETKESPKSEEKPKIGGGLFDDDSSDLPPFGLRRKRRDKTNDDSKGGLFDDPVEPPRYGRQSKAAREREELDSAADSLFDDVDMEPSTGAEVSKVTITEDKTQIEKESEKREKDKEATKDKSPDLFEDDEIDGTTKEEVVIKSPAVEIREPTPEKEVDKDKEADKEADKDKEVDKEADKEVDKEVTIEPPKETKTDDKKVSRRERSSTELGTSATGKAGKVVVDKKSGKPEPSWMADLKKKRESGEKSTSTVKKTATKPASAAAKDEEEVVPEWQKRVLERRKNRSATSSPKTSGRLSAKTETTSSTRSATKSPSSDRKSPNSRRKSPAPGSKSSKSEQKSTVTERKSRFDRDKDERGFSKSVDVKSSRKTTNVSLKTSSTKEEKPTEPKEETDAAKPKLSRKPSSEMISKRISVSTSKSPRGSTTSPEPAAGKESKLAEGDDEVFVEGKAAVEKKSTGRTPSPKVSVDLVSSVLVEESVTTADSVAKESVTSEKASIKENSTEADQKPTSSTSSISSDRERAQSPPFRSHSISRSPTPTSPTTGPLKLKADPDIPEWKKKLLEKKKPAGTTPVTKRATASTAKKEPELPAWKKELLARKQATPSTERKPRSATVAVSKPSSSPTTRAGRRDKDKVKETPAFMKEFKNKQRKD